MTNSRILIVGGGVIGLCTAYYARQRGHNVTVVERGAPDHDCCSLGNAGLVVPSHFVPLAAPGMIGKGLRMMLDPESPFYFRPRLNRDLWRWSWLFFRAARAKRVAAAAPVLCSLNLASRRLFEELADHTGDEFGLVKKGLLLLCRTEHGLKEETAAVPLARQLGLQVELLSANEARRLEPDLDLNIAGAVYYPQDCHLVPERFVATMRRLAEEAGVQFSWSTEARGWHVDGRRVASVRTNYGDITADEFVVACGSWSAQVLRPLGLSLPLQAGKGYHLTLPQPRTLPTHSLILTEGRVAVTPMGDALRFAGTMEIAGMDTALNPHRIAGIMKTIPQYLPDFAAADLQKARPWCGLRPCSPDGLPYIGRFTRYMNLSLATGHAMLGLSLGPITGKLMAEALSGETPSIALDQLRPDRYG